MIPLKVQCNCGQKYAFDVTPVNGQMPHTVACPVCGMDGTALANIALAEKLASIATAPAVRISGAPPLAAAALPAPLPAPLPASRPTHAASAHRPAGPATAAQRPMATGSAVRPVKRGNDGWATDETGLNKMGTQITVTCSIVAALLAWHIFDITVDPMILGTGVAIGGITGGILNVYGRGPVWAGALIGATIALGGYITVEWWIHSRESIWALELTLAFCVGTLPGFGLQYGLQKLLRRKD